MPTSETERLADPSIPCQTSHGGDSLNEEGIQEPNGSTIGCGKEEIFDAVLLYAAQEIAAGKIDANLGGCLFKRRLSRSGIGKRGYKRPNVERMISLYAFAKSDKANISAKEEAALSLVAESFVSTSEQQLQKLLAAGSI